jgi:hypothetical protein
MPVNLFVVLDDTNESVFQVESILLIKKRRGCPAHG